VVKAAPRLLSGAAMSRANFIAAAKAYALHDKARAPR